MDLEKFIIKPNGTLREALELIDANQHGMIFIASADRSITGVATDGDIRRQLIGGLSLEDEIMKCANPDFVWEDEFIPREKLLKKLNSKIRVIPLLNSKGHLIGIVSRDHLPIDGEKAVYARSRAPVRISFCGGGSDLTHYFSSNDGAVINATASIYSHATLRMREDERVIIHSLDLDETLTGQNLDEALSKKGSFGLIQALLKTVQPEFGFELFLNSDFPVGSGLGGSAVVSACILGCFNQFRFDQWNLYELAEIAYQAERIHFGVNGGWQDQYATVFGGFNFMEFRMDQNIVHPLRIPSDILLELEESLILVDTGITHDSGEIHEDQADQMSRPNISSMVKANVELSYAMRNQLLRGDLLQFGKSLHHSWKLKRQLGSRISSRWLDQIYNQALSNGAVGGKLLGAGGGGFFLFFAPANQKNNLISFMRNARLGVHPFRFEPNGLQAWKVRESSNIG